MLYTMKQLMHEWMDGLPGIVLTGASMITTSASLHDYVCLTYLWVCSCSILL